MEIDPIMVVNDNNTRNYQVNQQSQGNSHFSSDKVTAAIFGDNQHAHLSITDGGIVVDPKRQRVQEKAQLIEAQSMATQLSDGTSSAGAARQARLAL